MEEIWFNTCFLSSTQTSLPAPKHSAIDLVLSVCVCVCVTNNFSFSLEKVKKKTSFLYVLQHFIASTAFVFSQILMTVNRKTSWGQP